MQSYLYIISHFTLSLRQRCQLVRISRNFYGKLTHYGRYDFQAINPGFSDFNQHVSVQHFLALLTIAAQPQKSHRAFNSLVGYLAHPADSAGAYMCLFPAHVRLTVHVYCICASPSVPARAQHRLTTAWADFTGVEYLCSRYRARQRRVYYLISHSVCKFCGGQSQQSGLILVGFSNLSSCLLQLKSVQRSYRLLKKNTARNGNASFHQKKARIMRDALYVHQTLTLDMEMWKCGVDTN